MLLGNTQVVISHHLLRLCQDAEPCISKLLPSQHTFPDASFFQGLLIKHSSESSPTPSPLTPASPYWLNLITPYLTHVISAVTYP